MTTKEMQQYYIEQRKKREKIIADYLKANNKTFKQNTEFRPKNKIDKEFDLKITFFYSR